jgi:hypothetical protein
MTNLEWIIVVGAWVAVFILALGTIFTVWVAIRMAIPLMVIWTAKRLGYTADEFNQLLEDRINE